jgi:hypothetical protein
MKNPASEHMFAKQSPASQDHRMDMPGWQHDNQSIGETLFNDFDDLVLELSAASSL